MVNKFPKLALLLIAAGLVMPAFATNDNSEAMKASKEKQNAYIASQASKPAKSSKSKKAKQPVQVNPEDAAKKADPTK
ncbi:hypothetical protein [Chitinibacter sp. S2-10]|uniref:hypothetical protein n=1 Tax=Chitinibacter sp. S2-10 TaxID=3373597 RepID=UPI0039774AC5